MVESNLAMELWWLDRSSVCLSDTDTRGIILSGEKRT